MATGFRIPRLVLAGLGLAAVAAAPALAANVGTGAPPAPIVLTIDPFKTEVAAAPSQLASLLPQVSQPTEVEQTPSGPVFVPMFKKTDNADDPNNRGAGRFLDNHEFGIQLRSQF